jgi:2-oxoisovalerate dehydrogenase E2 component (dihydrolipoyl transacylase)
VSEYIVKLPDVGEGIAEAEIVEWHVNVGDTITEDQVMVEVMTDKATVELPSPVAGVVTSVGAAVGEVLQVGSPLIRIETSAGAEHEDRSPPASAQPDTLREQ